MSTMRPTLNDYLMQITLAVASRGTCPRRKVGCVFVDDAGHILATGYNGGLRGEPHCGTEHTEYVCGQTYETVNGCKATLTNNEYEKVCQGFFTVKKRKGWEADLQYNDNCSATAHYDVDGKCVNPLDSKYDLKPLMHACPGVNDKHGDTSRCAAIHAEINALLQCKDRDAVTRVICTNSPCVTCARLLRQGLPNLREVVFKEKYTDEGLAALGSVKWILHS